ncbi:MAG: hypothetical protein R3D85_03690 [Paracoccaceae bacterium]
MQYRDGDPVTLFTMVSNETGSGGHTSLMIDASQRVIFDPSDRSIIRVNVARKRNGDTLVLPRDRADVYTHYHAARPGMSSCRNWT